MKDTIKNIKEYDLIVIGAGSGGVRAARIAANHGAKVVIIESIRVGGTCVLRGCVPKKLLVYGAHIAHDLEDAAGFGWNIGSIEHDWAKLIHSKDKELDRLNNIYLNLLSKVDIINGFGKIISNNEVEINSNIIKANKILIAVGGKPFLPKIKGIDLCINSDQALDLKELPKKIIINGGGYIALEFAAIFASFGSDVTLIYRGKNLLRGFDYDISRLIKEEYIKSNIKVFTETEITSISKTKDALSVTLNNNKNIVSNEVMFATGRVPNTKGLGLGDIGVKTGLVGEIIVDKNNQTNIDNVYAIGDVTNRINLTPVAIAEGQVFSDNLYGEDGGVEVYKTSFKPMKQTLGGRDTKIFMKMIVRKKDNKVVGIHAIGDDMPEIIQICGVAIKAGATKDDFDNTMGIHPTAAEELVTLK